jgi:hypothetical protein
MKITQKQFKKDFNLLVAVCKNLSVTVDKNGKSYAYFPDSKVITIPNNATNKKDIIVGFLHEIGHVLHRDSMFSHLYKTENTNRAIILEGEYVAWSKGFYLLEKLNLDVYKDDYLKEWVKAWNAYIKHVNICSKTELYNMRSAIID